MPRYTPVEFALLDLTVMVQNQISWNIEIDAGDYVVEPVFTKDTTGLSEADAMTKWCPQIRMGQNQQPNTNRNMNDVGTHCAGSDCMVWKWDYVLGVKQTTGHCGLVKD